MATIQSGVGRIRMFEDFLGNEWPVANTDETPSFGQFRMIGVALGDGDTGITCNEASAPCLSGVGRITTCDEDNHSLGLATAKCFDVGLMGTLVAEARVQFVDLDTKEFYFGFTSENDDAEPVEGGIIHGATTVLTLTATDLCGFLLSAELTEDEMWHMPYNGGTATIRR